MVIYGVCMQCLCIYGCYGVNGCNVYVMSGYYVYMVGMYGYVVNGLCIYGYGWLWIVINGCEWL